MTSRGSYHWTKAQELKTNPEFIRKQWPTFVKALTVLQDLLEDDISQLLPSSRAYGLHHEIVILLRTAVANIDSEQVNLGNALKVAFPKSTITALRSVL